MYHKQVIIDDLAILYILFDIMMIVIINVLTSKYKKHFSPTCNVSVLYSYGIANFSLLVSTGCDLIRM